jgi:hypothetical protein
MVPVGAYEDSAEMLSLAPSEAYEAGTIGVGASDIDCSRGLQMQRQSRYRTLGCSHGAIKRALQEMALRTSIY